MGYFDGLTDAIFKKNASGQTVYYPWGVFGKGYVIESEDQKIKVRNFVKKSYYFILPIATLLGYITSQIIHSDILVPYLGGVFILGVFYVVFFLLKTKSLLQGCPLSTEKLSLGEGYRNSARSHNLVTLVVLEIASIGFVVLGLALFMNTEKILLPILCIGMFGFCSIAIGYMIVSKLKNRSNERAG